MSYAKSFLYFTALYQEFIIPVVLIEKFVWTRPVCSDFNQFWPGGTSLNFGTSFGLVAHLWTLAPVLAWWHIFELWHQFWPGGTYLNFGTNSSPGPILVAQQWRQWKLIRCHVMQISEVCKLQGHMFKVSSCLESCESCPEAHSMAVDKAHQFQNNLKTDTSWPEAWRLEILSKRMFIKICCGHVEISHLFQTLFQSKLICY